MFSILTNFMPLTYWWLWN